MRFKHPLLFLALIPLFLVVVRAYFAMLRGRYASNLSIPMKRLWGFNTGFSQLPPRFWHILGYAMGGAMLVIALARPQTSFNKQKRTVEGIDIVILLDLSASMRIEDFRNQNRMEVSKPLIKEFIEWRASDKIGFEIFSGEAVTMIPPTLDHAVVFQALEDAQIGDLKDGTAIGDALATAVGRLKESTAKSKIIVLFTDGDSNVGSVDPLTAGELAKGFGIKIYSIAIGRDGRVAMPFIQKDIFGRQVKTYQYFDSSINPDLPRQISTMTGGKFYRIQDDAGDIRAAFADVDKLERTKIQTTEQVKYDERFMKFLLSGLLILLATFALQNTVLRVYP